MLGTNLRSQVSAMPEILISGEFTCNYMEGTANVKMPALRCPALPGAGAPGAEVSHFPDEYIE